MKIKCVLIIVIPILFLFSLVFFSIMPKIFQREEQAFQAARQQGWTTYIIEGSSWGENQIVTDATDKIWITGGGGLNVFDGTTWLHRPGSYDDLAIGPQGQMLAVQPFVGIVDVIDVLAGQSLKTYEGPIRQVGTETIQERVNQVEIDSNGRIWVVSRSITNDHTIESISEMLIQRDKQSLHSRRQNSLSRVVII